MFRLPLFTKSPAPEPAENLPPADEFGRAMQYHCEVRGMDDRPVFLADAKEYDGTAVRLFPTMGREAPPVIYNNEYKLVFRVPQRPIPVWTGRVRGSSQEFWKLDDLTRFHDEQRATFRQRVTLSASLRALLRLPQQGEPLQEGYLSAKSLSCRILDMGLGGLQFSSPGAFSPGDLLAVTELRLAHDPNPFSLPLQVRWSEAGADGTYRCGCAYPTIDVQAQDRLCAAIFGLQRASMHRY